MKKFIKGVATLSVLAAAVSGASTAMAEVSGNIGATSNYIWRGVTQTGDDAAIQGGLDYSHESGFYAGTWLSNVNFGEPEANNQYEQDIYLGYAGSVGDFGFDVGAIQYMYPLSEDSDFTELAASGSFKNFTLGLAYTVSSDIDDTDGAAETFIEGDLYYYASAEFDLPQELKLGVLLGAYSFDDDGEGGADLDYSHYQVGLTKSAGDMGDFTFALDKNDMDGATASGKDFDDPRVSVSWTKSF